MSLLRALLPLAIAVPSVANAVPIRMFSASSHDDTFGQNLPSRPCVSANPLREDFVSVLAGGRYFAHSDGTPFIPIGINHNTDWPQLEESNPLAKTYDPMRTDHWFTRLHEHGVNVVRIMVETPQSGNLEEQVGTFRPAQVAWLDNIFLAARRHGVKLWMTPYDTFWMNQRKDASPYWRANGGPIDKPIDFLTKPEIIADQERRMKFLIDRYGNTGTVFAWEIMNEIDLWWGASPEQIKAWTDQMAAYVRKYEKQRWGRNHMLTISFANAEPSGLNAETAFRRPDLDFATMHLYLGASRAPGANDAHRAGIDFAGGVLYARGKIRDNRPVLDGESGPIDHWISDEALDDEVFYEMSWRHLMAGGAGPGTRWPYRHPHTVTAGMLNTLQAMSLFCRTVPWKSMTGPASEASFIASGDAESAALGTTDGAIGWLRLQSPGEVTFKWGGAAAQHHIGFFDLHAKQRIKIPYQATPGEIRFTPPAGVRELAMWISR